MNGDRAIAIIPARLGSTRFPGKVLAAETGRPLIQHVWEAAHRAATIARVIIATDDETVRSAAERFGAECVLTSPAHPNGSSRLAEVCELLALPADAVVVNVQGDEPEIDPQVIDAAVLALTAGSCPCATVASPLKPGEDASNPNVVKVVRRLDGTALYFSRAPIPFDRDGMGGGVDPLRHVGVYAYRVEFLREYVQRHESALEKTERLEQLRILENGWSIAVAVMPSFHAGIDTPEQYAAFVERWRRGGGAGC